MNSATVREGAQIDPESLLIARGALNESYKGTAEQLIAAGIVEVRHLPGLGNERKTCASFRGGVLVPKNGYRREEKDSDDWMMVTRLTNGRFQVYRSLPDPTQAVYDALIEKMKRPMESAPTCQLEKAIATIARAIAEVDPALRESIGAMLGLLVRAPEQAAVVTPTLIKLISALQ